MVNIPSVTLNWVPVITGYTHIRRSILIPSAIDEPNPFPGNMSPTCHLRLLSLSVVWLELLLVRFVLVVIDDVDDGNGDVSNWLVDNWCWKNKTKRVCGLKVVFFCLLIQSTLLLKVNKVQNGCRNNVMVFLLKLLTKYMVYLWHTTAHSVTCSTVNSGV